MTAGYHYDDMDKYVIKRLNEIHKITVKQAFDMYENDVTKIHQPNKWKGKIISKDIYNPCTDEFPMPLDYDVRVQLQVGKK